MSNVSPSAPLSVFELTRNKSDTVIERLNAQKNRSKLYLIKSYSFMDKSLKNHAPKRAKLSQTPTHTKNACCQNTTLTNAKISVNKPNTVSKKSKSSNNDALDDDLCALLRFPAVVREGEVCETRARRQSLPDDSVTDAAAPASPTKKSNKVTGNTFKRDSFFRHSLQSIRRSFSAHKKFTGFGHNAATNSNTSTTSKSSANSSTASTASVSSAADAPNIQQYSYSNGSGKGGITILLNENIVYRGEKTCEIGGYNSKSVSTFAETPNDPTSMATLQSHTGTQSVTTLNLYEKDGTPIDSKSNATQLHPQKQHHKRHSSNQGDYYTTTNYTTTDSSARTSNNCGERRSLNSLVKCESTNSIRSLSPTSRKSTTSSNWSGQTTAKHEQSTAAATAAAATTAVPAEKEKKRKEVSSSRVKKFHRHFTQVSKDEKLINYFSCALVSDILLQGHLYITDQHFAFYSNVFGYVTKVVIPTSSVTKISKEKTAKIIPNAVGVATADERHVFGSFISREAAFRLMCSVCPPLAPIEILPKAPADIEISEEYSIEDDSSCSISGNESPPQALVAAAAKAALGSGVDELGQTLIHRNITGGSKANIADAKINTNGTQRHSDIAVDAKEARAFPKSSVYASASPVARYNFNNGKANNVVNATAHVSSTDCIITTPGIALIVAGTASSTTSGSSSPTPSTSSSLPTTVMAKVPKTAAHAAITSFKMLTQKALLRLKFPTEIHVVYLGVLLTMVLALFSVFLLYRVLDIEAKTSAYRTPTEFNWRSGNDDDIFAEALRWQKELQAKSTEEAQNILSHNLEQIAKVRRSLETLSMLIHDRSSAHTNGDDSD
ncbi:serine-rich adhesin for platelets-like isoform X1 [Eurosta solidaginis]|uniref:serine-rich adhesin for platelets-like isoform X1 n=1 Tax=Eurosta solidaginis TaxID=178769 RepID=UPI0035305A03